MSPHPAAGLAGAGGVREGNRPRRGASAAPVRGHALRSGGPAGPHPAGGSAAAARPAGRDRSHAGGGLCWTLCRTISGCSLWSSIPLWPPAGREDWAMCGKPASGALRGPHPATRPGLCRPAGPAAPRAGAALTDRDRELARSGGRAVHQQGDRRRPLPLRGTVKRNTSNQLYAKLGMGRDPHPPRPLGQVVPEKRPRN